MARPLRIEYPGAWYHVMNRVAGRGIVLKDPWAHRLFLALLQDLDQRFDVECHAYCLMGNHYHLLLHTPEANLGLAMRHFSGLFTQRFNRHGHRDGPLFRGRYKAILVDADSYLLAVSRYIHRNPLEAGLVRKLDSYPGSSYPAYVGKSTAPKWLRTDRVLDVLGSRSAKSQYRAFVEQSGADDVSDFFKQDHQAPILGSADFVKRALRGFKPNPEQPKRRSLQHRPKLGEILDAVSRAFEVSNSELRHTPRGRGQRNIPRAVAMYLCQMQGQMRLAEIAQHFSVGHYATVSVTIKRSKVDLEQGGSLRHKVEALEERLQ